MEGATRSLIYSPFCTERIISCPLKHKQFMSLYNARHYSTFSTFLHRRLLLEFDTLAPPHPTLSSDFVSQIPPSSHSPTDAGDTHTHWLSSTGQWPCKPPPCRGKLVVIQWQARHRDGSLASAHTPPSSCSHGKGGRIIGVLRPGPFRLSERSLSLSWSKALLWTIEIFCWGTHWQGCWKSRQIAQGALTKYPLKLTASTRGIHSVLLK